MVNFKCKWADKFLAQSRDNGQEGAEAAERAGGGVEVGLREEQPRVPAEGGRQVLEGGRGQVQGEGEVAGAGERWRSIKSTEDFIEVREIGRGHNYVRP